jgi:hypothetical protein
MNSLAVILESPPSFLKSQGFEEAITRLSRLRLSTQLDGLVRTKARLRCPELGAQSAQDGLTTTLALLKSHPGESAPVKGCTRATHAIRCCSLSQAGPAGS